MSLIERLKNPEDHYEFADPKKANAVLMSLCQEAADALSAPVQEPVAIGWDTKTDTPIMGYTTPPAAQRQWAVPATMKVSTAPSYEFANGWNACVATIEAKIKEKNT